MLNRSSVKGDVSAPVARKIRRFPSSRSSRRGTRRSRRCQYHHTAAIHQQQHQQLQQQLSSLLGDFFLAQQQHHTMADKVIAMQAERLQGDLITVNSPLSEAVATTTSSSCSLITVPLQLPKSPETLLRRQRRYSHFLTHSPALGFVILLIFACFSGSSWAFTLTAWPRSVFPRSVSTHSIRTASSSSSSSTSAAAAVTTTTSPSALGVTWFGGTAEAEVSNGNSDSCELVAVRIERTSANSRRILGEIVVPDCPLDRVWSILTDYDRLSIHVPNLVESRVVSVQTPQYKPGDGRFRCRLFQKGAQKIVGFEFGASVTMDMVENILPARSSPYALAPAVNGNANANDSSSSSSSSAAAAAAARPLEARSIRFKCYDSFFFSEFDGEWKATEEQDPASGNIQTVLSYVVDVRPKGPVPVAALEWRIREDVPTNLRAVKRAALKTRQQQTKPTAPLASSESLNAYTPEKLPSAQQQRSRRPLTPRQLQEASRARPQSSRPASREAVPPKAAAFRVKVNWDEDETLGAYLR